MVCMTSTGRRRAVRVSWAALGLLWFVATAAAQTPLFSARLVGALAPEEEFALRMPSAVARLSGDRWAILDGVHNRVVVTDDHGRGLATLGEAILDAPLGLTVGPEGRLWIADTGHRRIVALDENGTVVFEAALPDAAGGERPPDPVDLAFDSDAVTLLVVDNDNHRVLSLDTASGQWGAVWGRAGMGIDEFNHPFSIAVGGGHHRAVVDVINSRVLSHDSEDDFTFHLGEWGVDAGQFYRPKGVAIDDEGRIWVSDSVLGVIQVFDEMGELIGVLADGDEVRHFPTPTRLAFDERGRLAVVEMRANRITLWEVNP